MPRRPTLGPAAAALSALLALTACQGSPEAGRPNTAPPPSSTTPTPTASTPTWSTEEQTAIDAATARYKAARAAVGLELRHPENADRKRLEAAGNGGAWLTSITEYIVYLRDRKLYQAGEAKIESATPTSVDLAAEQPVVALKTCVDGSSGQMRYLKTDKPVPVATTAGGTRHTIDARLVYAPSAAGTRMWFLVDEKTVGSC